MPFDILNGLKDWLPYTARQALYGDRHDEVDPASSKLLQRPELQRMAEDPDIEPVLGAARMLSKDSLIPEDHLFTALLRSRLVDDMLFLYDAKRREAHLVVQLGTNVCGHAKVVHGGLIAAMLDETFGALVYSLKQDQVVGSEPAVTANLNVNYRQPLPTQSCIVCTVKLANIERRKMFLEGSVTDVAGKTTYAEASALFINMKPGAMNGNGSQTADQAAKHELETLPVDRDQWHKAPRYESLCKELGMN